LEARVSAPWWVFDGEEMREKWPTMLCSGERSRPSWQWGLEMSKEEEEGQRRCAMLEGDMVVSSSLWMGRKMSRRKGRGLWID
jgi:hypothetical protein